MPDPKPGGASPGMRAAENASPLAMSKQPMALRLATDATLAILLTVALANPAMGQVYRCVEGETTVFSDVPCAEDAELHQIHAGISVVAAADDLDAIAERNRAYVDQRREVLAKQRQRARSDRAGGQAARRQQDRAAAEEIRYRTIIGPAARSALRGQRTPQTDPRTEAQRRPAAVEDTPERRRTLLSRSGGNQPRILR